MAQSTLTKGSSPQLENGEVTSSRLLLVSSLASLDRYFAGLGAPATPPALERGIATSKRPQNEFLAPPEIGPYR